MQYRIEQITMSFDEGNIYKDSSKIISILINKEKENAKEYIIRHLPDNDPLIESLLLFGQYTLEALIVHVLSVLFSNAYESMIRLSTLVETLDRYVHDHARSLSPKKKVPSDSVYADGDTEDDHLHKVSKKKGDKNHRFRIGANLLTFMIEREIIKIIDNQNEQVVTKGSSSYFQKHALFAICNFSISELPMKINLPMLCKPKDWSYNGSLLDGTVVRLSNLTGGYLTHPLGYMHDRYSLLSSTDQRRFNIRFNDKFLDVLQLMNKLQNQKFKINSSFLNYILENEDHFVESGLLKPKFLCSVNLAQASLLLREVYLSHPIIVESYKYSQLLATLESDINIACFEQRVLTLAQAFDGYTFYIPAFLDFRGRIYRSGLLHLHERDLVRSLILFEGNTQIDLTVIKEAVGFHYQKFNTDRAALLWYNKNHTEFENMNFVRDAKNPFQFMSKYLAIKNNERDTLANLPITQDASASAFQILSYLLLNEELAVKTNLIPSKDGRIQDIYMYFLSELKDFFKKKLSDNTPLLGVVLDHLSRDLVKKIYMPIIYGKTITSTTDDLFKVLSSFITYKEALMLSKLCFEYWQNKYKGVDSLIKLVRHTSWIASASEHALWYSSSYFSTEQDYHVFEPIKLSVYDRLHKKRRQITLRVPTDRRNRTKTLTSTFANFIHQKDANIAMHVVHYTLNDDTPIYTVHDNFLTNSTNCRNMKKYYLCAFHELTPPLSLISLFMAENLLEWQNMPVDHLKRLIFVKDGIYLLRPEFFDSLNFDIPKTKRKHLHKTFEERVAGLRECYYQYVRAISKDSDSLDDYHEYHRIRLENFRKKMWRKNKYNNHYCVHL